MDRKLNEFEELLIPQFLISQMPFEEDLILSNRLWQYCPRALSLIGVLVTDNLDNNGLERFFPQKFSGKFPDGESLEFLFLLIQNNCEKTGYDPETLLLSEGEWWMVFQILGLAGSIFCWY